MDKYSATSQFGARRAYVSPAMRIVALRHRSQLLNGSKQPSATYMKDPTFENTQSSGYYEE